MASSSGNIETIARGETSRLVEPRRFLIRDRSAFSAIWTAHAGPDAADSVPAVDFDRRMVAAVFAGERPSAGHGIEITRTRRDADALTIFVEESAPDSGVVAAQILVTPFHIVTLPRDDGEVRFDPPNGGQQAIVFKPHRSARAARGVDSAGGQQKSRLPVSADDRTSSTGLTPENAAMLAYVAGPLSGALLLAIERTNRFVRFHAWQAVLALGGLGTAAILCLLLAFALLLVSPTAFWTMLWISAAAGAAWIALWAVCLVEAFRGRMLKLPLAGDFAERHA